MSNTSGILQRARIASNRSFAIEGLEMRRLLSADSSLVYPAHAKVHGQTLQEWSANWWQKVFSIPVFANDGETIVNPQLDDAAVHGLFSDSHHVFFLFGSFTGGTITRNVTVPANTPIFLPLVNTEWSNPDTPAAPDYKTVPGNYSAAELAAFAATEAQATDQISLTIDGQAVPDLFSHRETAPIFSYTLPEKNNIDQVFFGEDISGKVSPVAADGYYVMLRPLSVGEHVVHLSGHIPDLSSTPPLLTEFTFDATQVLTVVKGLKKPVIDLGAVPPTAAASARVDVSIASDVFGNDDVILA